MKTMCLVLGMAVGVAGVGMAIAGPLDKGKVDKGAKWVVHLDVEAALRSTTGKFVVEHRKALELEPIEELKEKMGIDVFSDVKDVTVYGMSDDLDGGVAIVRGSKAIEGAIEKLMAEEKGVEKADVGGREVISWKEGGSTRYGHLRKDGEGRVFAVAQDRGTLEKAMGVLEGKGESLAGEREGVMAKSPRKDAVVYVAATELQDLAPGDAPKALRSARELSAELGEDGEGLYADLQLKAGAVEDVADIADLAKGLIATGKMATRDDPDLKELHEVIKGIRVDAKGDVLSASIRIKRELLTAALEDLKADLDGKHEKPKIEKASTKKKEKKAA